MSIQSKVQDLLDISASTLSDNSIIEAKLIGGTINMDMESDASNKALAARTAISWAKKSLKVGAKDFDVGNDELVGQKPSKVPFDMENFDNSNPEAVMALNFEVNVAEEHQHESVEAFFPTLDVDPTYAAIKVTVSTTYIQNSQKRILGVEKADPQALLNVMFDLNGPLGKNELKLIPIVMDDGHIVDDFKVSIIHPETNEKVDTGPFELGVDIDVITESQTEAMLSENILDEKTILATLPVVEAVAVDITTKDEDDNDVTDHIYFDVSTLEGAIWKDGVTGGEQSIELKIRDTKRFNLALIENFDGGETENLKNLSRDYNVDLEFILSGEGNLQAPLNTRVESISLKGVYDISGNKVAEDANDDVKAIVDAVKSIEPKGAKYELFIPNKALEKDGTYLVTKKYTKLLGIKPMKPQSLQSSLLKDGQVNDDLDINNLISYVYSISTVMGLITLDNELKKMKADTAGNIPLEASGRTYPLMKLVKPYYATKTFKVREMVDSKISTEKREATKAAFEDFLSVQFTEMIISTNYKNVADTAKIKYVPVLMVPPLMITAIGDTVTINGVEVKMVSNTAKEFSNRAILVIGTVDKTESTAGFRFGSFVKMPSIAGERITNSVSKVTVIPYGEHHITLPIATEITMPDITTFADKNVVNMRVVE